MHRAFAFLFIVSMLSFAGTMWSQTTDQQSTTENLQPGQSPANGAAPAAGQAQAPSLSSEFPPLSGVEEGTLEPNVAARSFALLGAQAGESVSTNASNNLNGGTTFTGITHVLGSAALQRLWSRYQAALSYEGGGAFYNRGAGRTVSQLHDLRFESRVLWRTGALSFADSARYMPDGFFGGGIGGAGGALGGVGGLGGFGGGLGSGIGGGGGGRLGLFGQGLSGSLGNIPSLTNISVVELRQALSPRSAFTMEGGFNFVHFTKASNGLLVDSQQVTGEAGYNYTLNRRNQLGIIYAYEHFHFPQVGFGSFQTHLAYLEYGHQISGRMRFTMGAGPQLTDFNSLTLGRTVRVSASGRASLNYRFPRTSLSLSYARATTAGAGFFSGANTDIATAEISRPISRRWDLAGSLGYNHSSRLQQFAVQTTGVPAASFQSGFIGGRLTHPFNRNLSGFFNYHFAYLVFNSTFCVNPGTCGRISKAQTISIGVNWRSRPYRLD